MIWCYKLHVTNTSFLSELCCGSPLSVTICSVNASHGCKTFGRVQKCASTAISGKLQCGVVVKSSYVQKQLQGIYFLNHKLAF